jgi:DNA-binding transcriptional ArsR family regulator
MSAKDDGVDPAAGRRVVTITDPLAIRALAHKVRLEVIDEFFSSKRAHTATELAGRFGLTPSAMSYHLRALEKWGYVVRTGSEGDGRERYWVAAGDSLNVGSLAGAPDLLSSSFVDVTLGIARDRVVRALKYSQQFSDEDKPTFETSTSKYLLTKEQSEGFAAEFRALSEKYRTLSEAAEADPAADARHNYVTMILVPEAPPGMED